MAHPKNNEKQSCSELSRSCEIESEIFYGVCSDGALGCLGTAGGGRGGDFQHPGCDYGGSTVNAVDWKALLFTSAPGLWTIDNVSIGLNPDNFASVPSSPKVEVALYAVSGGVPTVQLATTGLQTVNINQLTQSYSITTTGFQLAGSTNYALVVRSDATGIKWGNTGATEPTGSNGFAYSTFLASENAGGSWASVFSNSLPVVKKNAIEINATSVPEGIPTLSGGALIMLAVLLEFIVTRRSRGLEA